MVTMTTSRARQLYDAEKLKLLKTYKTERPVNSASISPIKDHVRM